MKKTLLISIMFFLAISINLVSASVTSVTPSSPGNATYTSDTTPDFVFTAESDYDATLSCELFVNTTYGYGINASTINATATTITSNTTLPDATYSWFINCTDVNDTVQSSTFILTVDSTNPTVNIVTPTATGTYKIPFGSSTYSIPLNFTYSDINAEACWYNIGAGNVALASCNNATISMSANTYTFTVYANDSAGNIGSDSLTLTVSTANANYLPAPFNVVLVVAVGASIVFILMGFMFAERITIEQMIAGFITVVLAVIIVGSMIV